jgi:hypothetical protein
MFQPYTKQVRRVVPHGIKAGGVWLSHLGIFAGVLWLSAQMHEQPSAAEKPMKPPERAESAREDPFPELHDPRCSWPSDDVRPFLYSVMTQPVLLAGAPLEYTSEALAAHVSGFMAVRCTLTCRGEVKGCHVLKGLPHMSEAVISMLQSRRYLPVQYQDRPINVRYVFHIRVPPP